MRETRKKLAAAVQASGTTLTGIFGMGLVIAAVVIGEAGDTDRFAGRDRFAAYNGTAPIEVSSGNRTVRLLSRRGNRRLNHAVAHGRRHPGQPHPNWWRSTNGYSARRAGWPLLAGWDGEFRSDRPEVPGPALCRFWAPLAVVRGVRLL